MLKMKTMAAAISMAIVSVGPGSAQNSKQSEDIGGWLVETQLKPGAELDPLCILTSPKDTGTFIKFNNSRGVGPTVRGKGYFQVYTDLVISNEERLLFRDASIRIDGTERWKKDVIWRKQEGNRGVLNAQLDDKIDALIRPFSVGRAVKVVVTAADGKESSIEVKLAGSHRAFEVYENCLAKVRVAPE